MFIWYLLLKNIYLKKIFFLTDTKQYIKVFKLNNNNKAKLHRSFINLNLNRILQSKKSFILKKIHKKIHKASISSIPPHYFLKTSNHKINDGLQSKKTFSYNFYLKLYFSSIFLIYTGVNIEWSFVNFLTITNSNKFNLMVYSINIKSVLKDFYINNKEYFREWFGRLVFIKDPNGFVDLIQSIIQQQHLQRHRGLFFLVNRIMSLWFFYSTRYFKTKGYCLYFKGKLGKKGSVKKTKYFKKQGLISLTNKNIRINFRNYVIPTCTGVVGCSLNIFYMYMFTLVLMYITVYILTLVLILFYFYSKNMLNNISQISFTSIWSFVGNYYSDSFIFKFLIFQLGGIAPVFIFILKVNLLSLSLKYTSVFLQLLIFINLLLGMFFYLEIFFTLNTKTNIYLFKLLTSESKILEQNLKSHNNFLYNFHIFFFIYFFLFACGFFFFPDFYIILSGFILP